MMMDVNEPISEIAVNSVIIFPPDGHKVRASEPVDVRGMTWNGGYGGLREMLRKGVSQKRL